MKNSLQFVRHYSYNSKCIKNIQKYAKTNYTSRKKRIKQAILIMNNFLHVFLKQSLI